MNGTAESTPLPLPIFWRKIDAHIVCGCITILQETQSFANAWNYQCLLWTWCYKTNSLQEVLSGRIDRLGKDADLFADLEITAAAQALRLVGEHCFDLNDDNLCVAYRSLNIEIPVDVPKMSSYHLIGMFKSRILALNRKKSQISAKNPFFNHFLPHKSSRLLIQKYLPESANFQSLLMFKLL